MGQYISKDALVAKIERKIDEINQFGKIASYEVGLVDAYKIVLSFLDTIEVKDVHLEKETEQNIWKPADGEDLPELEREVVVLHQPYPLEGSEYAVGFAHRPDPKGWDGTNIATEKVEHYTPKTYDKGGWNIPDIKWWLNVKLPCGGRTISMNYTDKNEKQIK